MESWILEHLLTGAIAVLPLFAAATSEAAPGPNEGDDEPSREIQIVEQFIDAFNAKDVETIMSYFTSDAVYHNMPGPPAQGTEAIRKLIESFVNGASEVDWETLAIAQSGNKVLTERIDRFVFGDKSVELPVMGTFEVQDGKISAWRDYFDMATWTRQMQD